MSLFESSFFGLVRISIDCLGYLQFFLTDVNDVVGRLGEATSRGFLKYLLFLYCCHTMIVVAAPDSLLVIFDVAVVVTTLSCAIVDAHTVQVISLIG